MVCFCIPNISSKGAAVEEMSIPDWLYAVKKYNLNYDGMKRVKNGGDGRIVIKSGFAVWQEKKSRFLEWSVLRNFYLSLNNVERSMLLIQIILCM